MQQLASAWLHRDGSESSSALDDCSGSGEWPWKEQSPDTSPVTQLCPWLLARLQVKGEAAVGSQKAKGRSNLPVTEVHFSTLHLLPALKQLKQSTVLMSQIQNIFYKKQRSP